jgi:two-component system, chemotaxis family, protein-glutamate methylesterase/glutaminase
VTRLGAPGRDKYAPSVDRLFASAAKHFGGRDLLAIVLTGMGDDGRAGAASGRPGAGWWRNPRRRR